MPATFRAFLQGLAAAGPEVVRLMQYRQQVDLQEREVKVREGGLAESKRQYDEGKEYRDTQTAALKAGMENDAKRVTIEEQRTSIQESLAQSQIETDKLERQIQSNELEFQKSTSEERRLALVNQNKLLSAQAAEAYGRTSALREQAKIYGLQQYDAQLDLKSKMAQIRAAGYGDAGFQTFFSTEFGSYDEMFKAAATMDMDPTTRINVMGLMGTIINTLQTEQDIRARALSGAEDGKQFTKMMDAYDAAPGTVKLSSIFGAMGLPLNDMLNPPTQMAEQPAEQGGGFDLMGAGRGAYNATQGLRDMRGKVGLGATIGLGRGISSLYNANPLNPPIGNAGGQ